MAGGIRQRIERLERAIIPAAAQRHVLLMRFVDVKDDPGYPRSASCGGKTIERLPGESAEAFQVRASECFPANSWGIVLISLD